MRSYEEILAYKREHYAANRERILAQRRAAYETLREEHLAHRRERYAVKQEQTVEQRLACRREHYAANRERLLAQGKVARAARRESPDYAASHEEVLASRREAYAAKVAAKKKEKEGAGEAVENLAIEIELDRLEDVRFRTKDGWKVYFGHRVFLYSPGGARRLKEPLIRRTHG